MQNKTFSKHLIKGPQSIPLYVEIYGDVPSIKGTIVFIHGGYQSLQSFRRQYPVLSQQYRIVGIDLPWHGESNPIPHEIQGTPDIWADSVHAVLSSLNLIGQPLIIAFWSFGGFVMRHYLHKYGHHHFSGLISIASLISGFPLYMQYFTEQQKNESVFSTPITPQSSAEQVFTLINQFVESLTKYKPSPADYYMTYGYNAKVYLTATKNIVTAMMIEDLIGTPDLLKQLDLPVLLIQGKDDALVSPLLTRHIAQLLPRSTLLEYDDCGHSTFLEQSDRFNSDVQKFTHSILNP